MNRIDTAREDQIAASRFELHHRLVNGAERRGAGGIDHEIGATEVEAIGHPAGGHVGQQAGETVFGPLRKILEGRTAGLRKRARNFRARPVLDAKLTEPAAPSDHDRCRLPFPHLAVAVARILESLLDRGKGQELHGVDGRYGIGRHPEAHGIERKVVDKASILRVDLVSRRSIIVEIQAPIPARRRDFLDGIDLVEDVFPILPG